MGRTCEIGLAAAGRGAAVEIVGRVGDDRAGDSLLIALSRAGVGHAAVLRDPVVSTPIMAQSSDPDPVDDLLADVPGTVAQGIDSGPLLEPADVALGLSYLTAFGVLVVTDDAPAEVLGACVAGAAFSGAHLVVLVPADRPPPGGLPADAVVLIAPGDPTDAAFGAVVGSYAAAVDGGEDPAPAFRAATRSAGWEPAEGG
ncbi:MAG: PfkB protein [Chloroflexota bacterium]|nr:PfkB protein [Chloroflexota bacterium]